MQFSEAFGLCRGGSCLPRLGNSLIFILKKAVASLTP